MNKNIVAAVVVVAVASAAFFGGVSYAKSKTMARGNFAGQMGGQFRMNGGVPGAGAGSGQGVRGNFTGGGTVSGEVIAKDDKSVTVKLRDGGSKIVFVSTSTQVSKMATGSMADVVVGEQVAVMGTANSDGSVTGTNIQLRPAFVSSTTGMMPMGQMAPEQK